MLDSQIARANILVVDDDDDVREALVELLEMIGHQVEGARNGREALRALREGSRPDVILLDLLMPELNGWEFRIEQRKDASFANIPVIAVTAELSPMARAIDAAAFVSKPFEMKAVQAAIDGVLKLRRSELLAQTEKLAALGRLAASVAHEINNPLAFIKANVNYVQQELVGLLRSAPAHKREEMFEVTSEAMQGIERIELIVKDILLFGRTHETSMQAVDVREPLRLALKVASARLRMVEVETDLPSCPAVRGDAARLSQVFMNLIVNAADAMETGQGPRRLSISCSSSGAEVIIRVADSGPGISTELLPRLFEPFFSTKPAGNGTGLGLFVCRGLVSSMSGRIEVESRLGEGTVFSVTLPTADTGSELCSA